MLFVFLCIRFGGMHYAIAMVRRSVKRIELHRAGRAVDDVVTSAGGHKDCEPRLDAMLNAIKHRPAFAFLYPKELIELVDLCTVSSPGLRLITTSWQFFAVYKTVRNVLFCCAAFSILQSP